jgi:nicotinamide-nucleotide amidase
VDIHLVARGPCALQAVVQAEAAVRSLLGPYIFGHDEETLEEVVVRELTVRARTVALAESCTGGYIANRLTNIPGASAVLRAGWVTYSNAAKETCLDVPAGILQEHGAVSGAVACAMARGARIHAQSDFALAVTGIAGPDGGSAEKPVGTVHIALAHAQGETAACFHNPYDRETFKYVTSQQALEWLRRTVLADR